ncbi:hypothetical protein BD410DRAFT_845388 [Rickenella mellea]|uniref:Uncharacterized protein n=1 Tax=Rickenella mellea TaxID=50990 RepID=A0A4Y7PIB9_9AGAM|nr:hypothetical protein BD410DRAFT_845388 [Rickenella mellea]
MDLTPRPLNAAKAIPHPSSTEAEHIRRRERYAERKKELGSSIRTSRTRHNQNVDAREESVEEESAEEESVTAGTVRPRQRNVQLSNNPLKRQRIYRPEDAPGDAPEFAQSGHSCTDAVVIYTEPDSYAAGEFARRTSDPWHPSSEYGDTSEPEPGAPARLFPHFNSDDCPGAGMPMYSMNHPATRGEECSVASGDVDHEMDGHEVHAVGSVDGAEKDSLQYQIPMFAVNPISHSEASASRGSKIQRHEERAKKAAVAVRRSTRKQTVLVTQRFKADQ